MTNINTSQNPNRTITRNLERDRTSSTIKDRDLKLRIILHGPETTKETISINHLRLIETKFPTLFFKLRELNFRFTNKQKVNRVHFDKIQSSRPKVITSSTSSIPKKNTIHKNREIRGLENLKD